MNTKLQTFFASLVLPHIAMFPVAAHGEDAATPLLPAHSTWALRWDTTLDGELKSEEPPVSWRVEVCNNRIHVDGGRSVLSGEIIDGMFPTFTLRQDDARGFVAIYSGKLTEQRVIIGTWFNTRGQSGDFKLTIENLTSQASLSASDDSASRSPSPDPARPPEKTR